MKLIMRDNGFCEGVELKREPTEEEIFYCLSEILGFDTEFTLSGLNETELKGTKDDIREVFIRFLKGKAEWWKLCETLCSYDDREEFTIGIFAHLLTWVEDKGII